ncbi:MAG: hypothetical protein ACXW4Z_09445 [Candidatus Binatia bacterium]
MPWRRYFSLFAFLPRYCRGVDWALRIALFGLWALELIADQGSGAQP